MKRILSLFAFLLVILAPEAQTPAAVPPPPAGTNRPRWTFNPLEPGAHDPVMAKEGDTFHVFFTGRGISHLVSRDLKTWQMAKPVFQQSPAWINSYLSDFRGSFWAPDILFYKGEYHLFYSCSAFGKNTSLIGHASSPTLDSTAVWTDRGKVVQSVPERDRWNAIDPNIIVDESGTPWMDFGSFWDGIKLVKLKEDLSGLVQPEEWHSICRRSRTQALPDTDPGDGAVEAPFIFRHGGYYYLFASYDYCCKGLNSNYYVVVGRSEKVTGSYLDVEGRSMAQGGGTVVLKGDEKWAAAGHCAVYAVDGTDYLLAHGYSKAENGASKLLVRVLEWDSQGWPVVTK